MNERTQLRNQIVEILKTTGSYGEGNNAAVYPGAPDAFDGRSPVAAVVGRGYIPQHRGRGLFSIVPLLQVSIYVKRPAGQEGETEDSLDELVEEAIMALHAAGLLIEQTDAESGGATLRDIDGDLYRVERIPIQRQF